MNVPPIMTAGFDDLIPVIIIITVIITRIMKAAREAKPLVPPAPGDRPRSTPRPQPQAQPSQPADELREFLEALSGVRQERPEPPPPPVQVQRPTARDRRQPPPPPRAAQRIQRAHQASPIIVEACELTPARQELNKHIEDSRSLRGAWILREVLGPPVALRQ